MKNPFLNLKSDKFLKNIILVFFGTFLTSLCNLLYQLIIAHRLTAEDFAAFNSLLSIYMLISTPLITLQLAVAKRTSELSAARDSNAIKIFLSGLLRKLFFPIVISFIIFYAAIIFSMSRLKIYSPASGNIITILFFFAWLVPIFTGSLQGLERFGWLVSSSVVSGIVKLILVIVFMGMGFKIAGALGAFLLATFFILILSIIPLRRYLTFKKQAGDAELKSMFIYLLPIMLGNFCYMFLINSDIVLVKYYFPPGEAGFYALAQMVGKILLFLPGAISIVMFP
ncbi:MAG: oligosaccharide flippase family protein, partial [Candidatus Omnitrophota bacterium]